MRYLIIPLALFTGFLFSGIALSDDTRKEDMLPPSGTIQSFEWSNYGLRLEWVKNEKLIKDLGLTEEQKKGLDILFKESTQTVKMDEEIRINEIKLNSQLELKKQIRITGQSSNVNMEEVNTLIDKLNTLKGDVFKIEMSTKARLWLLLTEAQRNTLYFHFRKKEEEQKEAMRKKMREGMSGGPRGGGMGGRPGGGGGMPPF